MKLITGVLLLAASALANGLDTLVKIDTGWVSGSGVGVRVYKGIPYASAPVGQFRWKPPQPAKPWKGILVAKSFPAQGDLVFLYGTRSVLRAASKLPKRVAGLSVSVNPNTFQYQFTRVNGIGRQIHWGSFHASEIPYIWETLPDSVYGTGASFLGDFSVNADTYNEQDRKLSRAMSAAWVAFAKTGSPNGAGLAHWPAFAVKESYMEFGDRIAARESLRKRQIDFMSEFTEGLRSHVAVSAASGSRP